MLQTRAEGLAGESVAPTTVTEVRDVADRPHLSPASPYSGNTGSEVSLLHTEN